MSNRSTSPSRPASSFTPFARDARSARPSHSRASVNSSAWFALYAPLFGVVGAVIGSFLNVCIARWPRDESVVRPRSRCPGCGAGIAWHDNIPVLSWVLLRAKCRACGAPISWQYPLVEATSAVLWIGANTESEMKVRKDLAERTEVLQCERVEHVVCVRS